MSIIQGKYSLGIILAIFGVVLFSAKAVIVKLAYQYDIDAVPLLLLRMAFALPIYVVIALILGTKKTGQIKKSYFLWIAFFGILGYYLASYFDFQGLVYIKASLERIILFIYPTLVLIISRIFLGKKISRYQILAIGITYLGIVITFWDEIGVDGDSLIIGAGLIFLSALTYASYLVGSDWLIPKFGASLFTSYAMIVSCLAVFIHFMAVEESSLLQYPSEIYLLAIAMAVLSTIIPSYLVSASIKILGASNFAIIGSLGPISTIVLANIFLDERFTALQIIGTIIVISGVAIVSRKSKD